MRLEEVFKCRVIHLYKAYIYVRMDINIGILLAALGITVLEMSEATAVGMALYADSRSSSAYGAVSLGVITVLIPTMLVGNYITLLPILYVRLVSATLLLYFGQRLAKSARRAFRFQRQGPHAAPKHGETEKGILSTAYSVGLVEAFEAAIVLVALFPENYDSTGFGLVGGLIIVIFAAYLLRSQIRKVKQATVKTAVSAILLSFAAFWYMESFASISDLYLIPMFALFYVIIYFFATRGLGNAGKPQAS